MKKILLVIVLIIIIVLGGWFLLSHNSNTPPGNTVATSTIPNPPVLVATASYACDASKTITAAYYNGASTPSTDPNQPPTPGGSVILTLSDSRTMSLPQTISADGTRYANANDAFVFWSKGNTAFVTEGSAQTFTGCIQVVSDSGGLPQTYASSTEAFSLRYPANYILNDKYTYQALGPGKGINGVKFTIDPSIATGTNLSNDSYVSVEQIPNAQNCSASLFLSKGNMMGTAQAVTDNGTDYSVASSSDAGAGNRYLETVYAIPGTSPCIAVRYYVHYTVFENYPKGTVTAFDQASLTAQFDAIRRTLTIGR